MAWSNCRHKRRVAAAIVASSLSGGGGCVSGSLASNTGPRLVGDQWSVARRQNAHVGEQVRFDFILQDWLQRFVHPTGLADYCVATIGGKRIETEPEPAGHFRFDYLFDRVQAGDEIEVRATAYRQRGGRDFMKVHGQWLKSDSPYEEDDRRVAGDKIVLTFYEAIVELSMVRPPDDLDPETGVMRIRRSDGSTTSVYIDRPRRPGFRIAGPEPDGYYRVSYKPVGTQLNPIGTTDVEFTIYDQGGQRHYVSTKLGTP